MLFILNKQKYNAETVFESRRNATKDFIKLYLYDEYRIYCERVSGIKKHKPSRIITPSSSNPVTPFGAFHSSAFKDDVDLLDNLIEMFLEGKNLDGENRNTGDSDPLNSLIDMLDNYDPNKSRTGKSEKYDLFESKAGLIAKHFGDYYIKSNLSKMKNFHGINLSVSGKDSEDVKTHDEVLSELAGADTNDGIESIQILNELDETYLVRVVYETFFENNVKPLEGVKPLCEFYNFVMHTSYQNIVGMKNGYLDRAGLSIIKEDRLDADDWDRIPHLWDKKFIDNFYSRNLGEYKTLKMKEFASYITEEDRLSYLLKFFEYLIKLNISLNVESTEYFKNLFSLGNTLLDADGDLKEQIAEVMESTKLNTTKYPEFPLLGDTDLNMVIKSSAGSAKISKSKFTADMKNGALEVRGVKSLDNLPPKVKKFINRNNFTYNTSMAGLMSVSDRYYEPGIWVLDVSDKDVTILKEIERCKNKKSIKEFLDIHEFLSELKEEEDFLLNVNDSEAFLEQQIVDLLERGRGEYQRLSQLIELIDKALNEVTFVTTLEYSVDGDALNTKVPVEWFKLNPRYRIPLLKYKKVEGRAIIKLYEDVELYVYKSDLSRGVFKYKDLPLKEVRLDTDSSSLIVSKTRSSIEKIMAQREDLARDNKTEKSLPQIEDLLSSYNKPNEEIKKTIKKNVGSVASLNIADEAVIDPDDVLDMF